jgi:hypothetical protein
MLAPSSNLASFEFVANTEACIYIVSAYLQIRDYSRVRVRDRIVRAGMWVHIRDGLPPRPDTLDAHLHDIRMTDLIVSLVKRLLK